MSRDPGTPPAAERHQRPDSFHGAEGPRALQKAINRTQSARDSEGKNEPWAAIFERVENQHRGNSKESESGERVQCSPLNGNAIVKQSSRSQRGIGYVSEYSSRLKLSTANYYARLSMNIVLGVERLPFLQGRAPRWKSGGPSPRDGSVLRRRSELPSRDRAPALIGLSSAQPALSFPDRHVIVTDRTQFGKRLMRRVRWVSA